MPDPAPPNDRSEPRRPKIVEALLQDFNLIALGGVVALSVLTQSPIPLIVGAAAEALYLINAPGSKLFEQYLGIQRARRRGRRRETWRSRGLAALPRTDRERFRATQRRLASTRDALDEETRAIVLVELDRVEDLLDQMLELLTVRTAARSYLATVNVEALMAEGQQVKRRMKSIDYPDLTRVEVQRLEVLEKRVNEYREMQKNLEIVTSQIATIEHSVAYLADKLVSWSAAGREPQGLRQILDGVESTEQAMNQVRPVVEQIQRARQA